MKDGQSEASSDEFKVAQVIRVDTRSWVNLEGVVVMGGVFKQSIARIEDLVGEEEEPLSACGD